MYPSQYGEGEIMADQVLDPEAAMRRDADKKKAIATRTSEVVRDAFIEDYKKNFKKKPDLTNPMINMFFNAWISAQGDRKWLTPEEIQTEKRRQILNQKRRQTVAQNNIKRRGSK
jgi:hypothetical protein